MQQRGSTITGEPVPDNWAYTYLWSRCLTILAGSSEIQRGIIGERLLGLPRDLRGSVLSPAGGTEQFDADEFVRRVGAREGVGEDDAAIHTQAVLATIAESVPGDLDYVKAQLSPDYAPLFDGR